MKLNNFYSKYFFRIVIISIVISQLVTSINKKTLRTSETTKVKSIRLLTIDRKFSTL